MKCPNCNMDMKHDYCIHCGYMKNGSTIKYNKPMASDLENYLGEDYDKVIRGDTYISTFILGPLYLSYKKFWLAGIILGFLDCAVIFLFGKLGFIIDMIDVSVINYEFLFVVGSFFLLRVLWMAIDNLIYIKLLEKKIKKIRLKGDYMTFIKNKNDNNASLLGVIVPIALMIVVYLYYLAYFK